MPLRYLIYTLLDWSFTLSCWGLINWWAPLFITSTGHLPRWLKWVDTFDDVLDAGTRDGVFPAKDAGYKNRVRWLNRNPGYGFSYYVLGIRFDATEWMVEEYDEKAGTFTARARSGHYNKRFVVWQPRQLRSWRLPGLRVKYGMKAWNMYDTDTKTWKTQAWGPEMRISFSCSPGRF